MDLVVGQEEIYTAAYSPLTATLPIALAWDNGTVGPTAVYSWTMPGTYTIAVTAANACGFADTNMTVTVLPSCTSVSNADFHWEPPSPIVGQAVTLTAVASGTWPIRFSWELGDGMTAEGPTVTHRYQDAGSYQVVMTAGNCTTHTMTATHTIVVEEAPCRPVSILATDYQVDDCTVTFTAALSGSAPFSYDWDLGPFGQSSSLTVAARFSFRPLASGSRPAAG